MAWVGILSTTRDQYFRDVNYGNVVYTATVFLQQRLDEVLTYL